MVMIIIIVIMMVMMLALGYLAVDKFVLAPPEIGQPAVETATSSGKESAAQ